MTEEQQYAQPLQPVPWPGQTGLAPQHGYAPAVQTDQRIDGAVTAVAWVIAVITFGYMLPWAIAATRGKSNAGAIGLVNFLAGWTLIGWIVALVMACGSHRVAYAGPPVTVMVAQQHFPQAQVGNAVLAAPAAPPAGWYASPDGAGQRYWDGQMWTQHQTP